MGTRAIRSNMDDSLITNSDLPLVNRISKAIEEVKLTDNMLVKDKTMQRRKDFQEQFWEVKGGGNWSYKGIGYPICKDEPGSCTNSTP